MAQNLMVCQFCEISNIIRWKCLNCDLILCEECKIKIHTKNKMLLEHTIIDHKKLGTAEAADLMGKLNLKNITCLNHREEKCSRYCKNCSVPVCFSCVLELNHQGHKFEKLETLYDVQLEKLKDRKETVERNIPCISEKAETINKLLSDGNISYNEARQKILQRESEMKELVTEESKKLLKELDELWLPQKEKLVSKEQTIKQRQQKLKQRKVDIDEALQSREAMSILKIIHPIDEEIVIDSMSTLYGEKVSVIERSEFKIYVNMNMFLMLKTTNMIKVIANYETDESDVSALKTLTNGRNFLFNRNTSTLKYFECQDQKYAIKNKAKVKMKDVTITKNNEIYFVGFDNPEIYTLNEKNKINTFTVIKDKTLTCIQATKNNTLLVGFFLPRLDKSRSNQSVEENGIIVLDMKGNLLKTFHTIDAYRYRGFRCPYKLAININGDICVILQENQNDFRKEGQIGIISVLGALGHQKWDYKGHRIINNIFFSPNDIVTTRSGMVVVTDTHSDTIQLLSINGDFLTSIGQEDGICRPRCLNIDNEGLLQIGTAGKRYESAKIHVVKIFE